jgi:hypothetical protein
MCNIDEIRQMPSVFDVMEAKVTRRHEELRATNLKKEENASLAQDRASQIHHSHVLKHKLKYLPD